MSKPDKSDTGICGIDFGMFIQQTAYLCQNIPQLIRVGFVAKADLMTKSDPIALRELFQAHGCQLTVGNGDDRSLQGSQPCGSKAYVLHGTLELTSPAKVSDLDGLV